MDTQQFDALEHYRAATQLDQIVLANRNRGWAACRDVLVEWHLSAVRTALTGSDVPRGAADQDPAVQEALVRFYQYQIRLTTCRLKDEQIDVPAVELKTKPTDKEALAILEGLQSLPG